MFLKEFEGSSLFEKYGIPVPKGLLLERAVLDDGDAIEKAARGFAGGAGAAGFVVKAQILGGGRGKGGAILFAANNDLTDKIFELDRKMKSAEILIQEKIPVEKELYLAVTVNRAGRCPRFIFSATGGIEIEETASAKPDEVFSLDINDHRESQTLKKLEKFYESVDFLKNAGAKNNPTKQLFSITEKLLSLFKSEDALLAEINPLALTSDGKLVALDAKVTIDDNALFRHPEYDKLRGRDLTLTEIEAVEAGLSYVELEGDIAVVGNGAGLVMATLDSIAQKGGRAANFCDIGGGATKEMMRTALKIVMSRKNLNGLLINIFGGITRCDEIALGILDFFESAKSSLPTVIRLTGTNEEEAGKILKKKFGEVYADFNDAVSATAKLSKHHDGTDR